MVLYAVVYSRATVQVHDYSVHMYVRCCMHGTPLSPVGTRFHVSGCELNGI